MKIISRLNLLAFAAIFAFYSCESNTATTEENKVEENREEAKEEITEAHNDVIDAYQELKEALVKADVDAAKKAVQDMKVELDKVNTEKLSAEEIANWNAEAKKLREHLDKMQVSTNIAEIRTHFSPLSDALYANVKKVGLTDETIYYQHCPMAFDNKGAGWLSEEEEISNPYFGDAMLRCGETKETIQKN